MDSNSRAAAPPWLRWLRLSPPEMAPFLAAPNRSGQSIASRNTGEDRPAASGDVDRRRGNWKVKTGHSLELRMLCGWVASPISLGTICARTLRYARGSRQPVTRWTATEVLAGQARLGLWRAAYCEPDAELGLLHPPQQRVGRP